MCRKVRKVVTAGHICQQNINPLKVSELIIQKPFASCRSVCVELFNSFFSQNPSLKGVGSSLQRNHIYLAFES